MTNGEWIRSLTDAELSEYLYSIYLAGKLIYKCDTDINTKSLFTSVEMQQIDFEKWLNEYKEQ